LQLKVLTLLPPFKPGACQNLRNCPI
jgi:hypothetical protein